MSVHPSQTARLAAWSSPHRGLVLILALTALIALSYGALVPPFEGPDAVAHLAYVAYLRDHPGFPPLDNESAAVSHELVQQPPLFYQLVAALTAPLALTPTLALFVPHPQWPEHSPRATLTLPGVPRWAWLPARMAVWVSLLGALLAAIAAYGLAITLLPSRPEVATAAAAVVGLNPQFLFSAASITNDTWVAGTSALAVWLAAWALTLDFPRARFLGGAACGLALGLGVVTKYSGIVAMIPVGVLVLIAGFHAKRGWMGLLSILSGITFGMLLVGGGWYGHNLMAYGALVPLETMWPLLGELVREHPATWAKVWQEAAWLPRSYWGVFGHGVVAPPPYDDVTNVLMLGGALGILLGIGRWLASSWRGLATSSLARGSEPSTSAPGRFCAPATFIALAWFGGQFAIQLEWIRTMHFGNQGRLLFPAASGLALLLVLGWDQLAPRQYRVLLIRTIPLAMLALALWQVTTLHAAYALPPAIAAPSYLDRPVAAHFAGGMTLLGADLPDAGAVRRGGVLPITLYWTTSAAITTSYRLFIHLAGPDDHIYARFDGVPFDGRHDTRQWVPGAVFADRYELAVESMPAATGTQGEPVDDAGGIVVEALLSAGFTDLVTGERVPLLGPDGQVHRRADGQPAAERAELGPVQLDRP